MARSAPDRSAVGNPDVVDDLIGGFASRSDLSARSTLVTVFGDTIAPGGGQVWLSDLFELVAPFGFSERLLRTSMSRLVAADWCVATRNGRRSRYALTDAAATETAEADRRIYAMPEVAWDGDWTLVLIDDDPDPNLRWNGFARLGPGVWGLPHDADGRHDRVVKRLGLDRLHPTATARFNDVARLVDEGRLTSGFELGELMSGYAGFVDRYQPLAAVAIDTLEPSRAFALRTMLIHDLRRLRLRDPDLPGALLPSPWSGRQAFDLATDLYRRLDQSAWVWARSCLSDTLAQLDGRVTRRFAQPAPPSAPSR